MGRLSISPSAVASSGSPRQPILSSKSSDDQAADLRELKRHQTVYAVIRSRLCAVYPPRDNINNGQMRSEYIAELLSPSIRPLGAEEGGPLEVNVIHTDQRDTVCALGFAARMARNLGACIRIRAAVPVPLQLQLDQSLISVQFIEKMLCDLARRFGAGVDEKTVQVYLCRDRIETLLRILGPHSLVVIAERRRWWRTPATRLAQALRDDGHDVVFVRPENSLTRAVL